MAHIPYNPATIVQQYNSLVQTHNQTLAELQNLSAQYTMLYNQHLDASDKLGLLNAQITSDKEAASKRNAELQTKLSERESVIDSLQVRLSELEQSAAEMQQVNSLAVADLQKQLSQLTSALDAERGELGRVQSEKSQLQSTVNDLMNQLLTSNETILKLREELADAVQELYSKNVM